MSLFSRNPSEAAYVGGQKHWADVIKNSGPGELLIWRQPEEDFNTNSTLIVMPGETAIFIKGGEIEQVFDHSGTYQLSTENYPFIGRLRAAFTGGISTFSCVVYFVRKADSQEIYWGTQSPIEVRDKYWGVRTSVRARGSYKVRIVDSAKFLQKLIGNNVYFQAQEELDKYFASEFQGKIKSTISKYLNALQEELIGLDARIEEISEIIEPSIDEMMQDYGLKCVKFSIAGLDVDTSKYDTLDEAQIASLSDIKRARTDQAVMDILGPNWARQQSAQILKDLANNPGAGGVAAAGAGAGVGFAAGGAFARMADEMFSGGAGASFQQPAIPVQGSHPGASRFTQQGAKQPAGQQSGGQTGSAEDFEALLMKLKSLREKDLISEEEYEKKKAEILGRM